MTIQQPQTERKKEKKKFLMTIHSHSDAIITIYDFIEIQISQ